MLSSLNEPLSSEYKCTNCVIDDAANAHARRFAFDGHLTGVSGTRRAAYNSEWLWWSLWIFDVIYIYTISARGVLISMTGDIPGNRQDERILVGENLCEVM